MPHLARLAAELQAMRSGRGPRRAELRRLLAEIDPTLRKARNIERLRLADAEMRLRALDSRADHAPLLRAVEEIGRRLAVLDDRVLKAIAARKK